MVREPLGGALQGDCGYFSERIGTAGREQSEESREAGRQPTKAVLCKKRRSSSCTDTRLKARPLDERPP